MRKIVSACLLLCLCFTLVACKDTPTTTNTASTTQPTTAGAIDYVSDYVTGKFSKVDLKDSFNSYNGSITFSSNSVQTTGTGVTVSGTVATINKGGVYTVNGSCGNGQLIVSVDKLEQVHIVLAGLSLSCQTGAPFWVKSADKVVVTLKSDTVNKFEDGTTFGADIDAPNACVYSKDDLTFNGAGSLEVISHLNNGIGCTNDLKFISGTYTVSALNNAIKGKDSIAVLAANITVLAADDAFKSDNDTEQGKGFIYIAGGNFDITATDDALQAITAIELAGGTFSIGCGGKSVNCDGAIHRAQSAQITTK